MIALRCSCNLVKSKRKCDTCPKVFSSVLAHGGGGLPKGGRGNLVVDGDGPEVDEEEHGDPEGVVEGEDEDEEVVGDPLGEPVDGVEGVGGVRGGPPGEEGGGRKGRRGQAEGGQRGEADS